eukprot:6979685-Lingulodinium_polyedra.AAC.1
MVFAWCARGVQFASRCSGRRSIRPHYCVAFAKRYTMMRSNRVYATTTARKSRASRAPCEHHVGCLHGARETCDSRAVVPADGR